MRYLFSTTVAGALLVVPTLVHAQAFSDVVIILLDIINRLVVFVFALMFLVFLWGIARAWIIGGGDEASVSKGKQIALAGVIGFVVAAGVWGIVEIIRSSIFF